MPDNKPTNRGPIAGHLVRVLSLQLSCRKPPHRPCNFRMSRSTDPYGILTTDSSRHTDLTSNSGEVVRYGDQSNPGMVSRSNAKTKPSHAISLVHVDVNRRRSSRPTQPVRDGGARDYESTP